MVNFEINNYRVGFKMIKDFYLGNFNNLLKYNVL